MIVRDDLPETPDWAMPVRPAAGAYEAPSVPPNIVLGDE